MESHIRETTVDDDIKVVVVSHMFSVCPSGIWLCAWPGIDYDFPYDLAPDTSAFDVSVFTKPRV